MKVGRRLGAVLVIAAGVWVVAPATTASAVPIDPACTGTTAGTTFTLTADCVTTVPLEVSDGFTVDGAGFAIIARDPAPPAAPFDGAVLTNAAGAATMNVRNLTITGEFGSASGSLLTGIFFVEAGGTVDNVTVEGMTRHSGAQQGLGIRANAIVGPARTVTITNTTVRDYQKGGLVASGAFMTMDVSGSTVGPPDELTNLNAQNGVQFGGASGGAGGSLTTSTIHGSGFTGNSTTDGTAVLLFAAANVTISGNSIVGAGTDVGIFLAATSTAVTIEDNDITRSSANTPDKSGVGVNVGAGSTATLTCNTFSGWVTNLQGTTQAPCITTTTPLPGGTVGSPYSATLAGHTPNPPVNWSASGLPAGLTVAPDGSISGTPTTPGTFTFTVTATDSTGATATRDFTITIAEAPPVPPVPPAAGWVPLGGLVVDSPAAASWGPGRLDVVVQGVDAQLWHKWFDAGWSAWEPLGGLTTAGPATTSWSAGRLDVFVNGTDGQLWHKWWDGAWSGWEPLGGLVVDSPAAASWGSGRLDVVVQGVDGQLWHKWFDAGWSAWEPLGGLTTAGPATTSWSAGRLDVFANGLDGQLWHKWWDGAWSDWVPLGGLVLDSPAAASWGPGRLDVVVRGVDAQPWHKWFDAGSWSGWEPLGGLTTAGPAATSSSAGQLDVFVNGIDGQLWHKS